MVTILLNLITR